LACRQCLRIDFVGGLIPALIVGFECEGGHQFVVFHINAALFLYFLYLRKLTPVKQQIAIFLFSCLRPFSGY
jgi:hypothetical protein